MLKESVARKHNGVIAQFWIFKIIFCINFGETFFSDMNKLGALNPGPNNLYWIRRCFSKWGNQNRIDCLCDFFDVKQKHKKILRTKIFTGQ